MSVVLCYYRRLYCHKTTAEVNNRGQCTVIPLICSLHTEWSVSQDNGHILVNLASNNDTHYENQFGARLKIYILIALNCIILRFHFMHLAYLVYRCTLNKCCNAHLSPRVYIKKHNNLYY